mmetsp:Transcript_14522/g.29037  ORF Transcript_14522/g.29037 Transcript_14522/m.29037 type:complete len:228 (-) Transcript_14522:470-1153(-)
MLGPAGGAYPYPYCGGCWYICCVGACCGCWYICCGCWYVGAAWYICWVGAWLYAGCWYALCTGCWYICWVGAGWPCICASCAMPGEYPPAAGAAIEAAGWAASCWGRGGEAEARALDWSEFIWRRAACWMSCLAVITGCCASDAARKLLSAFAASPVPLPVGFGRADKDMVDAPDGLLSSAASCGVTTSVEPRLFFVLVKAYFSRSAAGSKWLLEPFSAMVMASMTC